VLDEANRQSCLASQPKFDLASLYYTVYVRRPADLAQIRAELAHCVGDALTAVYLQAGMCREDLLLEIEATAVHPWMHLPAQRD
jgi:chorismate lyase/3-hydroxybenzoate synthase